MAKSKGEYVCTNCGYKSAKWMGRCPSCSQWDSFELHGTGEGDEKKPSQASPPPATPLKGIEYGEKGERWPLGWRFTDRMLGGGIVPGSLLLLGGSPGVGKSTLLLQWCKRLAESGKKTLYCSAEESVSQVGMRATRLNALSPGILVVSCNQLEALEVSIESTSPSIFVLDSIQMVQSEAAGGAPGSLSQVRECTARLMELCKHKGITGIIVGHITKEGTLAGPKSMEHMVDVVLQLEGERGGGTRILRVSKNRYGPTLEMAVLTMTKRGLMEVENPSQMFLKDRVPGTPGSVVTTSLEGNSPLLVEVQALVSSEVSGIPKRVVMGADPNRVAFIAAVLEKIAGMHLSRCDIYLNVPGGIRVGEPAADLAVAMAMASSFSRRGVPDCVVFGEVGLGGEVRMVPGVIQRIQESIRLGFKCVVLPQKNLEGLNWGGSKRLKLVGVRRIEDALDLCHNGSHQF